MQNTHIKFNTFPEKQLERLSISPCARASFFACLWHSRYILRKLKFCNIPIGLHMTWEEDMNTCIRSHTKFDNGYDMKYVKRRYCYLTQPHSGDMSLQIYSRRGYQPCNWVIIVLFQKTWQPRTKVGCVLGPCRVDLFVPHAPKVVYSGDKWWKC